MNTINQNANAVSGGIAKDSMHTNNQNKASTQNVTIEEKPVSVVSSGSRLEKISFYILLVTIAIAPLAFVSTTFAPLDMIKSAIITFGVLISSIFYFFSLFKEKKLYIPKHKLNIYGAFLTLSLLVSAFSSSNIWKSFFGQGFEINTVSFILTLFLTVYLVSCFIKSDNRRYNKILSAIAISSIVIMIFHILRFIFGIEFMSFGIFKTTTSTMLGKWYDLGILATVITLLSYTCIRFNNKEISLKSKIFTITLLVVSSLFVFIMNSPIAWVIMSIVMVLIALYEYSICSVECVTEKTGIASFFSKLPKLTLVLILISVIMIWKGASIATPVVDKMKVWNPEVVLPWQLTIDVIADTAKESPILGAGPNRFTSQFLKYKPQVVNSTQFWGMEFSNGFGIIPSTLVTQGILGFVLWVLFIIVFFNTGAKTLKNNIADKASRFMIASTFFVSLFLILMSIIYVPSHSILLLTAVFLGIFISTTSKGEYNISSKFATKLTMIFIAIIVLWSAIYMKKIIAMSYFQSGISALSTQNSEAYDKAEIKFNKAISFDKSDIYYQGLSEIGILRVNQLSQELQKQAQNDPKSLDQEKVKKVSTLIEGAIANARNAINTDPTNYYNYLAEARISEVASVLAIPNAYENTKTSYENALKLNPYNPFIYLSLARLEVSQKKMNEAQQYIGTALQLKQNYSEAVFLLSQIQVNQGQIKEAIRSIQYISQISPNDPSLLFQLGLLQYNDKNYEEAVKSLDKAVKINGEYANAQYFLGLSYARLNMRNEAIIQFENLAKTNPENEEVQLILSNLSSGKAIFTDAKPPIDNKPEGRKTLPIQEKGKKAGI